MRFYKNQPVTGKPVPVHAVCLALATQERRVLQLIVPHRKLSSPIVAAAGLTVDHFGQDDHRLIFAAWLVAHDHDLSVVATLHLARRALHAAGLWDGTALAASSGMLHSDATLARLGVHRLTPEELDHAVGRGPDADPLPRAIARHVVALIAAAEALSAEAA